MNSIHEDFVSLSQLAMIYAGQDQLHKSEEILNDLLEKYSSRHESCLFEVVILNNLAFIYQKTGNFHKALALLSRAYTFKPLCEQDVCYFLATLMNLSTINCALGNHQQGLEQAFRAVELCEKENLLELKVTAYYNLSTILIILNRVNKARFYFRETMTLSRNFLGSRHKLTILSQNASAACLNPENFHFRVKSTGYASKNTSFTTSTTRVIKCSGKANETEQTKSMKVNSSTKIVAITKTGRNIVHKESMMGLPYVKEMKKNIRIDASLFKTPKKDVERQLRIKRMSNTLYLKSKKLDERFKRIKDFIGALEDQLEYFKSECRKLSKWAGFEEPDELMVKSALVIQNWFRDRRQAYVFKNIH